MKRLLTLLTLTFCGMTYSSQATLVWSDDFSYPDGPVPGTANVGSGTFETSGNVNIVNNALVLTADGGTDRIEFESTAGALAGNFTFDIELTPSPTSGTDIIFLQLVEGAVRSTGGVPVPNFADTIDVSAHSLGTPSTVNYFFNVTGSAITYIGPDGSTNTLNNDSYAYWVDNTLTSNNQTNSNSNFGPPTNGVDTLLLQTFGGQEGEIITIDNASFSIIPEPSTFALIVFGFGALALRRPRR